jgi:hypothetical protein
MKKSFINIKILILPLVVVLIVTSIWIVKFQIRTNIEQDIHYVNNSCILPCWNSIIPGVTTKDRAIEILKQISYIKSESIKETGTINLGGCLWSWNVSGRRLQPGLEWKDGIVSEITLGLAYDLTLQEVLNQLGLPDKISIVDGGIPEHWFWIVDLFYLSKGVQIEAYTAEYSTIVEPTTEIGAIILYSPASLDNFIEELYPDSGDGHNKWLYEYWQGYGDLITLYDIDE